MAMDNGVPITIHFDHGNSSKDEEIFGYRTSGTHNKRNRIIGLEYI